MIIEKLDHPDAISLGAKECGISEFEVGDIGRLFYNTGRGKDVTFASYIHAFEYLDIVCTENGEMPIAFQSNDCSRDWIYSNDMNNATLAKVKIDVGYSIIYVVNRKDFWEDRKPYNTVIIQRVDKLNRYDDCAEVLTMTTHRFLSNSIPEDLGFLRKPVQFALDRMINTHITSGSVPSYSKSISREYTTKLFIREGNDLVSYHNGSKLILHRESLEQELYDGTHDHKQAVGKFIKVFMPKKELGKPEIIVDGYSLYMVSELHFEFQRKFEQITKLAGSGELVVLETTTGYRFVGVRGKNGDLFGMYHSWEGFSMIRLTQKEAGMIEKVETYHHAA